MPRPIDSIELFYAHAIAIEREASERYAEFAEWFADRDEEVLAGLCRGLERLERDHMQMLRGASGALQLPPVAETRYHWLDASSPEAPARELFYRIASTRQLLEVALQAECDARRFFAWVARTSRETAVRRLARQMAREEGEHVCWVRQALEYREATPDWERLIAEGAGPGVLTAG